MSKLCCIKKGLSGLPIQSGIELSCETAMDFKPITKLIAISEINLKSSEIDEIIRNQ
jgi:hypothetical protein